MYFDENKDKQNYQNRDNRDNRENGTRNFQSRDNRNKDGFKRDGRDNNFKKEIKDIHKITLETLKQWDKMITNKSKLISWI